MRSAAIRWGAPAVVSEMVACEHLAGSDPEALARASRHSGAVPFILQLAGRDPHWMRVGAALAAAQGADTIDINMGCPAKRVTGGASGAALMRDLDRAEALITATLEGAGQVPVTLKMRLGWSDAELTAAPLAALAERCGVQMITVHARTRDQFYDGVADWRRVAEVRAATRLPLLINGDIDGLSAARQALAQSRADGVMVGRAAVGRPWLLAEIAAGLTGGLFSPPSPTQVLAALIAQVADSLDHHGPALGVKMVRKHVAGTLDHLGGEAYATARAALLRMGDGADLLEGLERLLARTDELTGRRELCRA
jgi:nifR3 family TIM-barrel protein